MWNWDYEEEGTNIRDGVRGTVTGGCSKGIFLALEVKRLLLTLED